MPTSACKKEEGDVARVRDEVGVVDRVVFFFNDTATTEIYTLSLHDALPIYRHRVGGGVGRAVGRVGDVGHRAVVQVGLGDEVGAGAGDRGQIGKAHG